MSSIIRRRSGLTVFVSFLGRSFLSEVELPSILRTGLPVAPSLSYRLATGLSAPAPTQRAGAQRLRAFAHLRRSRRRRESADITAGAERRQPRLRGDPSRGARGDQFEIGAEFAAAFHQVVIGLQA